MYLIRCLECTYSKSDNNYTCHCNITIIGTYFLASSSNCR